MEWASTAIFGEQVSGADGAIWLAGVRATLERIGYGVGASDLCSAGVGAPNIRQRLYWVGIANGTGSQPRGQATAPARHGSTAIAAGDPITLADSEQPRLEGLARDGDNGHEPGRERAHALGSVGASGEPRRMAEGLMRGSQVRRSEDDGSNRNGYSERYAHTNQLPTAEKLSAGSVSRNGPWDDYAVIPCRDGKARRIPRSAQSYVQPMAPQLPGLVAAGWSDGDAQALIEASKGFPLAKGVKHRVGLLRGAGNAINADLAAEFIGAVKEIYDHT